MAGRRRKMKCSFLNVPNFLLGPIVLLLIFDRNIQIFSQPLTADYAFNNRVIDKSASCDRSFIYFTITFAKPFLGLIYTDGAFGSQRCTYVNGSVFSQIRYNITIPLNECRSQTFPNGSSQNVIVVQRDWRILEASDNLFVISCTSASNSGSSSAGQNLSSGGKFTLSFAGITVQGTLASTEVVTSSFAEIDYTAQVILGNGPSGKKLDRPLGVGEQISYVVRLRKLRLGQVDARIGRCWATDGSQTSSASPTNTEIQLSDDEGCTVLPGSNIWNNFKSASLEGGEEGKILYNDIKAWAFPTSNRVNIFCNLHLCPATCPPSSCRSPDEKESTSLPPLSIFTSPSPSSTGRNTTEKRKNRRDVDEDEKSEDEPAMVARLSTAYEIVPDRRIRDDSAVEQPESVFINARLRDTQTGDVKNSKSDSAGKTVCLTYTNFVIGISLLMLIILVSFIFIVALLCKLSGRGPAKRDVYVDRIRRFFSNTGFASFRRRWRETDTIEANTDREIDSESAAANSTTGRINTR